MIAVFDDFAVIDKDRVYKNYVNISVKGYKRIAWIGLNFTGTSANIVTFVNNNLVNKGNYDLLTVGDLNTDFGFTLLKEFKFMAYDTNNLIFIGLFSGNANIDNSIRIYTTTKTNISYQPNPIGGQIIFIV